MMTMKSVMIIPATETPIDSWPRFLALAGADTAISDAITAHTYHTR